MTAASFNPAVLLRHIGLTATARLDAKDAASATQAAFKAAKADGLNLDAFKLCARIRRMDPLEGQALLQTTVSYLTASGSAAVLQSDLFNIDPVIVPSETLAAFTLGQIEIAGRMAGKAGGRAATDHEYVAGSQEAARWVKGWRAGDATRDKTGVVVVAAERQRPGPKPRPRVVTAPAVRGRPAGSKNKPKEANGAEGDVSH